jgi:hypothetical protein
MSVHLQILPCRVLFAIGTLVSTDSPSFGCFHPLKNIDVQHRLSYLPPEYGPFSGQISAIAAITTGVHPGG